MEFSIPKTPIDIIGNWVYNTFVESEQAIQKEKSDGSIRL